MPARPAAAPAKNLCRFLLDGLPTKLSKIQGRAFDFCLQLGKLCLVKARFAQLWPSLCVTCTLLNCIFSSSLLTPLKKLLDGTCAERSSPTVAMMSVSLVTGPCLWCSKGKRGNPIWTATEATAKPALQVEDNCYDDRLATAKPASHPGPPLLHSDTCRIGALADLFCYETPSLSLRSGPRWPKFLEGSSCSCSLS